MSTFDEHIAAMDAVVLTSRLAMNLTYKPLSGPAVPVRGIFDANYELVEASSHGSVSTLAPAVFLRKADLPTDPELDEPILTIAGEDYRVVKVKPDSLTGVVLVLKLVT